MVVHIGGVIFDVDGTLVDSNDAHAHAWVEAMKEHGYDVSFAKVRPLIGMGGDKVLPETIGVAKDSQQGKQVSQRRKQIFMERYLPTLKAFPDARDLLQHIHDQRLKMAIATSAEQDELNGLLQVLGPGTAELFEQETSSKDTSHSKPEPDVMDIALQRLGAEPDKIVMIGDTAYDIESAAQAGIKTIAFRCGGWSDKDLAGAICIYDGPADLLAHYDASPLAKGISVGASE